MLFVVCCLVVHVIVRAFCRYVTNVYSSSQLLCTFLLVAACCLLVHVTVCVFRRYVLYNCMRNTVICLQLFVLSSSFHHFSSFVLNCFWKEILLLDALYTWVQYILYECKCLMIWKVVANVCNSCPSPLLCACLLVVAMLLACACHHACVFEVCV